MPIDMESENIENIPEIKANRSDILYQLPLLAQSIKDSHEQMNIAWKTFEENVSKTSESILSRLNSNNFTEDQLREDMEKYKPLKWQSVNLISELKLNLGRLEAMIAFENYVFREDQLTYPELLKELE